jgi:hypothetical protein
MEPPSLASRAGRRVHPARPWGFFYRVGYSFIAVVDADPVVCSRESNTTLQMKTGHPLLLLEGGSVCPKSELQASTAIQFICDTSVFAAGALSSPISLNSYSKTSARSAMSCVRSSFRKANLSSLRSCLTMKTPHVLFSWSGGHM